MRLYRKIEIHIDIFWFLVVYMSTELTCTITVLDRRIYAEVEWDLRLLKLRVLEVGKNASIWKSTLNKLSGTRNLIMVSKGE